MKHDTVSLAVRQDNLILQLGLRLFSKLSQEEDHQHQYIKQKLRELGRLLLAEKPKLLTSTSLRKHIAVITQLLNLKENELDIVARFMGHDINIHRDFYRLPDSTLELAKVSKILPNLENRKLQNWKGKSSDEIQVTVDGKILSLF